MRVVQLLPELNEGGVERGVVELSRELVKRGVESIVISAGGKQAAQIDADGGRHIIFDVCSKNPLNAPLRILQLRRLFWSLRPDILHARSRVPAWLAYLANRPLGISFVTTVHGFNSVNPYSRIMTFGDRVICVSNAVKEYIQQHYQVADEKIVVIPRGVDLEVFNPARIDRGFAEDFKKKYDLQKKFVVSSVGRITQLKDYETFIRAIGLAKNEIPHICGLIVGGVRHDKVRYFNRLQELVTEFRLEEAIRFVGSQNRISEIYSISDLVVSCSKKPESFGRTAAEALAMNVPVIATNHGGVLDVVRPGRNGYLFDVGDVNKLSKLINEAAEHSLSGLRTGIENEFSLTAMVERTYYLYTSLNS